LSECAALITNDQFFGSSAGFLRDTGPSVRFGAGSAVRRGWVGAGCDGFGAGAFGAGVGAEAFGA
jgi:hypothetical protein